MMRATGSRRQVPRHAGTAIVLVAAGIYLVIRRPVGLVRLLRERRPGGGRRSCSVIAVRVLPTDRAQGSPSSRSATSPRRAAARSSFSDEYWAVSKRLRDRRHARRGAGPGRDLLHDRQALESLAAPQRGQSRMTAERRELPIAVFDSGVGGLTVLHECLVSLPAEDFVYLGDDAQFPYGAKTARAAARVRAAQRQVPARARGEAARHRLQLGDGRRRGRGARDRRPASRSRS